MPEKIVYEEFVIDILIVLQPDGQAVMSVDGIENETIYSSADRALLGFAGLVRSGTIYRASVLQNSRRITRTFERGKQNASG